PAGKGGVILNFQNASLADVLNYLSEAAGFIVVQEATVSGTVNVMSRQEVSPQEAVDLLNAVLIEKGFTAIRNGRILKIVNSKDAKKRDIPVGNGSDPDQIPRNDAIVTQILPLRYGEAAKLVENLQPLLSENATISANESANSILLTDTQTNIRRIATIIKAIDTSVSSISTIQVFPLRFADAKALATIVTQLFQVTATSGGNSGRNRGGGGGPGGGGGFGGFGAMFGGGGGQTPGGQSEARQAASRVVAVADEQSNSLIVSATKDLIPEITEVVEKLDTSIDAVSETRIFRLQYADATELAEVLTKLYPDTSSSSQGRNGRNQQGGRGGGFFGGFGGQPQQNTTGQQSERSLLQAKVVAVGDPRTNSLVVTAARDTMTQIAETIGRLDSTDAKKQRVYVHQLNHADADAVANVLRGMLGDQTAITNTQQNNRLNNRSTQGATMDTSDFSNTGGGGGGGGGGRGGR
ncbi:MAG: secretin N-terminal domain-containing protein, partial [Chthoniobacteraceae bacterium]